MSHVEIEQIRQDMCPVLYFQGKDKGVVLNKTNARTISAAYGDDTEAWAGQPVELYEAEVMYEGKAVPGIRMTVPRVAAQTQHAAPIQQRPAPPSHIITSPAANGSHPINMPVGSVTVDDEIPF